jgi:hypothetical protein
MARTIEAKAIISAEDHASKTFAAMAKRVAEISKAQSAFAKSGGAEFLRMQKTVADLDGKLAKIQGFRRLSRELDAASLSHRRAQQEAGKLKQALDAAGGSGGKVARDFERAQRGAERAAQAFRAQGQAAREARQGLEAAGIPINRLAQMERQLKQQIDAATEALKRQSQAVKNAQPWGAPPKSGSGVPIIPRVPAGQTGKTVVPPAPIVSPSPSVTAHRQKVELPIAEVGGAMGVVQAVKDTVTAGADVDTERSQARQAGWTEADIAKAEKRANELAARFGMAPGAAFNMVREARPTFGGDLDTTLGNVAPFFGVATAMRQKSPHAGPEEINKSINDMVKAGEILGYSNDPAQLVRYADLMTRMAQVFGSQLRGEEVLNLAKRSKTAGSDVSFDFLQDVLPTFLPELGGDATGVALMTLRQSLVGGKMKKRAAENLERLGLINQKDMIKTLDDDVVGVQPSAVKGAEIVRRNPLKWAQEVLIPAMDAKGVAPEDRSAIISTLFSDRNAEHMVNLLVTQANRIGKDKKLVDQALGIEGVQQALKDDPYLVAKRVGGAASNVGAALSDPFIGALKAAADAAANSLNTLAETARKDPSSTAAGATGGAAAGGLLGLLSSSGSGAFWRLLAGGVGAGAGGIAGGVMLPWAVGNFLESLKAQGPEGQKQFFGSAFPGFAGEIDKSFQAQKDGRRDPEAFRGRAMMGIGRGITPGPPDMSFLKDLEAVVKQPVPVDVTGKLDPVQLQGQATVDVRVKVEGPGQIGGMSTTSSGHIKAEGTALVGTPGGP